PAPAYSCSRTRNVPDTRIREPHARVADGDVVPREDDSFACGARAAPGAHKIERGQRASFARGRVCPEHRETVDALHELHRRGPPGVHLDDVRNPSAGDEA